MFNIYSDTNHEDMNMQILIERVVTISVEGTKITLILCFMLTAI